MFDIAEFACDSESTQNLIKISTRYNIAILAGLFENDNNDHLHKSYIFVDRNELIANHHKQHPFINPYLILGKCYTIFVI